MKYTKEPGRCIHRDGKPFIIIKRDESGEHVPPCQVDDIARFIVHLLNTYDEGMLRIINKENKS